MTCGRLLRVFPLLGVLLLVAACADKPGGPIAYNVPLPPPDQPKLLTLEQNYRIAPLDTLTVNIFRQRDLSGDYEVDLTGRINMPLIGSFEAWLCADPRVCGPTSI